MKTFKEYLNEIQFSPNTKKPTQYASGTIQSQPSIRPNASGTMSDQNRINQDEDPKKFTKTITDQNGNVVAQVDDMDASDTIRGLRTSSKGTGKDQAIRDVKGIKAGTIG